MFFGRRHCFAALLVAAALLRVAPAPPALAAQQTAAIAPGTAGAAIIAKAARLGPSLRQRIWQQQELTAFIHFGPNTYTGREIGLGTEDVNTVNPVNFDPDGWMRTLKDAGFKKVILVTKHHDGFVLWPTRYSRYSIAASRWRAGRGDIVAAFVRSARRYGLAIGFYLSPADLHEALHGGRYADGSRPTRVTIPTLVRGDTRVGTPSLQVTADNYNRYYMNELYELLTQYGPVEEVFFDGFNPLQRRAQPYDFANWYKLVRMLQPGAVMFAGLDTNWVGNEDGVARQTQWSVMPFSALPRPDQLTHVKDPTSPTAGDRASLVDSKTRLLTWYPAECDARIEAGWFWHPHARPKSAAALESMYFTSVGRNCQLLLDVPPNRSGRFDAADTRALHAFGAWVRKNFTTDLAMNATTTQTADGVIVTLPKLVRFRTVAAREQIAAGQRVEAFTIDLDSGDGRWTTVARGTTIGYKRLIRLAAAHVARRVRVVVLQAREKPAPLRLQLY